MKCQYSKCGKEFTPKKPFGRFCSSKCRVYHGREVGKKGGVALPKDYVGSIKTIKAVVDDVNSQAALNKEQDKKIQDMEQDRMDEFLSKAKEKNDIITEILSPVPQESPTGTLKAALDAIDQHCNSIGNTTEETQHGHHRLWKPNDPAEGSGNFFLKYGCESYDELEKKGK